MIKLVASLQPEGIKVRELGSDKEFDFSKPLASYLQEQYPEVNKTGGWPKSAKTPWGTLSGDKPDDMYNRVSVVYNLTPSDGSSA
jgi:hypothetical protein